jgi:hypothetical protein
MHNRIFTSNFKEAKLSNHRIGYMEAATEEPESVQNIKVV